VDPSVDEAQRAAWLVRQPPPAATLTWLVAELDASAVVEVRPMSGGSTAAMHRVTLIDRSGHDRVVVLRRYVRPEILTASADVAAVEARALRLAERLSVPMPNCRHAFDNRPHGHAGSQCVRRPSQLGRATRWK
jgi:hypothetical protein